MVAVPRPNKVKIGAHVINVYWTDTMWDNNVDVKERDDSVGRYYQYKDMIIIKGTELSPSQQKDTLLHEIMHACLGVCGVIPSGDDKGQVEEQIVLLITPALHQALQDNPKVFEWIGSK